MDSEADDVVVLKRGNGFVIARRDASWDETIKH